MTDDELRIRTATLRLNWALINWCLENYPPRVYVTFWAVCAWSVLLTGGTMLKRFPLGETDIPVFEQALLALNPTVVLFTIWAALSAVVAFQAWVRIEWVKRHLDQLL